MNGSISNDKTDNASKQKDLTQKGIDLCINLLRNLRNGSIDIVVMAIPKYNIKDLNIEYIDDLNDIFVGGKKFKDKKYKDIKELLNEDIILQKSPSITRNNFDLFLKDNDLECVPKMEVVSQGLLRELVEANFGIGLLTKEFIQDKLDKTLFEIEVSDNIPKRKLGYAIKSGSYPNFTTIKFIELFRNNNFIKVNFIFVRFKIFINSQ